MSVSERVLLLVDAAGGRWGWFMSGYAGGKQLVNAGWVVGVVTYPGYLWLLAG